LLKLVAVTGLPRIRQEAALNHATIFGTASTYNLRGQFGGVRYGKLYRPTYALVESGDKQIIVKINHVGPLRPGRVINLNERSMRHFDPFLRRGLIPDVKIYGIAR
jgi:rare lipoprotein A